MAERSIDDAKVGDVVVAVDGDMLGSERIYEDGTNKWHNIIKGNAYIVTKVFSNAFDTTDPYVGLTNGWGKEYFRVATKLDHIMFGIRHLCFVPVFIGEKSVGEC